MEVVTWMFEATSANEMKCKAAALTLDSSFCKKQIRCSLRASEKVKHSEKPGNTEKRQKYTSVHSLTGQSERDFETLLIRA